ncbi:PREDICTED: cell division cycle protein 20 homolog B [Cyprinodon variegatus]|uniref:cell division cycle protein 20 homolog B n=1 Tax=Cyprinodon variegatus TaxID=28743 RepID=UPI0007424F46|nr:PREDICTED: cell division cycle protein 20 homolog B [Cyprinodon variegatus]
MDVQISGRMLGCLMGKRRPLPLKGQNEADELAYKRFKTCIIQGSSRGGPAASTPLPSGRRCNPRIEFDTVCQRLELESSPRDPKQAQDVPQTHMQDLQTSVSSPQQHSITVRRSSDTETYKKVQWIWRAAVQPHDSSQQADSNERKPDLKPFANMNVQGMAQRTLWAPSLLNDYYTNLLDCSCDGMIALALGSTVYLWNSETRALVGHFQPSLEPGSPRCRTHTISCLSWSGDGRTLCTGNRRGEIQLWDVDHKQSMWCFKSHLSVVGAVSWKQRLLSSGSTLGHIHHLDPRAPSPVLGAAFQEEGICSLEWSPGNELLASGSKEGLLHIWEGDVAGIKTPCKPVISMKQPSSVKALGWCPWQRKVIATGGGWKDGQLRIWDTQSGSCLKSINTNSQICCLRWAEKRRYLITGHGLPHNLITSWSWEFPSLSPMHQLTGHSQRALHLAINPDNTNIFSAGADQRFCLWDL